MKYFFACVIGISFFAACTKPGSNTDNKINIGTIDSLHSNLLKEERRIYVHLPNSYTTKPGSKQHYPVIYLLDGDSHFSPVSAMVEQLAGNNVCPEMIIVGIPNTDRTRDLTPTHVTVDPPYMDSASSKTSGGGEQFMSFIEKELMPHIDSLYPANPYKILIGHSFGGLTVINTLMHRPKLFNAYIAIDPSMWWDGKKLLGEVQKNLVTTDFKGTSLFLGIANTMEAGMDTTKVQLDTVPDSKHIRSILALNHTLSAGGSSGLRFLSRYYNNDDHGSVPLITEYDGLHFIFDYFKPRFTGKDFSDITMVVASRFVSHYDTISARMGIKVSPPEDFINQLAYQASATKHSDAAEYLALLNTTNYPESAGAFDTLGDIYSDAGNRAKAIESFKKALAIQKDLPETQKKLDKLEKK